MNNHPEYLGWEPDTTLRAVQEAKVVAEHCHATFGGSAVLLLQDSQESLEQCRDALPEKGISSASDPQSGGSRTAHRRSSDSLPSQCCQSVLLILRSLRKFWVLNRSLNPEQKRQLAIVQFGSFKPGKRVRPKTLFGGNCRYALII